MHARKRLYYPISQYFRERFGERVYKISVSVADRCPNRQPNSRRAPCIFCDDWGSAAYHLERNLPLQQQIIINRERIAQRYRTACFLVYFQSYTNTFDSIARLNERFRTALSQAGVRGLVLGTRPDCLPKRMMPILRDVHERHYLMVELGVQSFFDHHLDYLRRGHDSACVKNAIAQLHQQAGVDIGVHLIFGLPGESDQEIIKTANIINKLPISNVKLHNLHVLANTPLAMSYLEGDFQPLELDEYGRRVVLFLRHLSPFIAVQRLAAVANRWDELVAPSWTREKMRPRQRIEELMEVWGARQGDCYGYPQLPKPRDSQGQ